MENQTPLGMLSGVWVGGKHGYICARTFTQPTIYDVRYDDGKVECGVSRDRIETAMPPEVAK